MGPEEWTELGVARGSFLFKTPIWDVLATGVIQELGALSPKLRLHSWFKLLI